MYNIDLLDMTGALPRLRDQPSPPNPDNPLPSPAVSLVDHTDNNTLLFPYLQHSILHINVTIQDNKYCLYSLYQTLNDSQKCPEIRMFEAYVAMSRYGTNLLNNSRLYVTVGKQPPQPTSWLTVNFFVISK